MRERDRFPRFKKIARGVTTAVVSVGTSIGSVGICPLDDILMITGAVTNQGQYEQVNKAVIPPELVITRPKILGEVKLRKRDN